ncbi:MAG: EcsC family protein [Gudongella sp.]|nr:EcsC family protein [Gudongella sp.]
MSSYENRARQELNIWKKNMEKRPSISQRISKGTQKRINDLFPEKYHEFITSTVKNITKLALFGSKFGKGKPLYGYTLAQREKILKEKTNFYSTAATLEGAATGAGGIVSGLADFPLLMTIKFKFLFEVAGIYGFNVDDYRERLFILNIFELAFSSKAHVNKVFSRMNNWDVYISSLPDDINDFQWREFQQEYRDYLDLAKLFQMIPLIGAVIGSYVNNKLMKKLSDTAKNAYRMRLLNPR